MQAGRLSVSTHSRLKAAGFAVGSGFTCLEVSTHSRLKAAGKVKLPPASSYAVSTHSRLKAAGSKTASYYLSRQAFQHTAA